MGVLALLTLSPEVAAAGQGGGSITGQILDSQGAPLAGVTVILTGGAIPVAGTTDNQGRYTFPGLTAPAYTVTPSKSGVTFDPLARTVTLLGGTAQLDFTGSAVTFAVSGSVVDSQRQPDGWRLDRSRPARPGWSRRPTAAGSMSSPASRPGTASR